MSGPFAFLSSAALNASVLNTLHKSYHKTTGLKTVNKCFFLGKFNGMQFLVQQNDTGRRRLASAFTIPA